MTCETQIARNWLQEPLPFNIYDVAFFASGHKLDCLGQVFNSGIGLSFIQMTFCSDGKPIGHTFHSHFLLLLLATPWRRGKTIFKTFPPTTNEVVRWAELAEQILDANSWHKTVCFLHFLTFVPIIFKNNNLFKLHVFEQLLFVLNLFFE